MLGKTLIDKASQVCGSDANLCRRMGISDSLLSLMKSGKRAITPEVAAELADIAGEDAHQAAIDAIIEKTAGTEKGRKMRDILGKAIAAGVGGMLVFSYSVDSIYAMEKRATKVDKTSVVSITKRGIHIVLSTIRQVGAFIVHHLRAPSLRSAPSGGAV